MTPQIQDWVKKVKKRYIKSPGKVLEIGSLDINGGVREFFSDAQDYIGIDATEGSGVNKVINAHDLLKFYKPSTFNTILCLEMLEHDNAFWVTIEILHKLLKKGGILIITTPTFGFPLHRYPKDYFRYGEDAYKDIIFKNFKIMELTEIRDELNSPGICCIGQKK